MRNLVRLTVALTVFASLGACKDDVATTGEDSGVATQADTGTATSADGGTDSTAPATDSGASGCPGVTNVPDPAIVEALSKMLGGWRWSKDIVNGNDADLPECDQALGYFIGPDVVLNDYATCAVARGDVIPLRGGRYPSAAAGCTDLACSNLGLLMTSAKSATVFALGANGKPTGQAAFYFQPVANATMSGVDLVQSNTVQLTTGKRLVRAPGVPTCK